jgi:uncharacterized protein (TIGR02421 family)
VASDIRYREMVRSLSDRVVSAQRGIRILDAIAWDDSIRQAFFEAGCEREPVIDADYYATRPLGFDPDALREEFAGIERDVTAQLGRFNPAGRILTRMCREYEVVLDLLAARGTDAFPELSASLYGRASDALHPGQPSIAQLAEVLDEVLRGIDASSFLESSPRDIPTEAAVVSLQQRLDASFGADGGGGVQIRVSDGIVADAAAGSDYIKLRKDAMFSERDLRVLEVHEGWVHVGTTLNGRHQDVCTFLEKGTPSTTITQEGLAFLTEILSFSSHPARLRRVTDRVRAIEMAESGAGFLEVFRALRGEGRPDDEAYNTAMRVFRGSHPRGGPFTKDLAYSRGFVQLYNFLRVAVRRGRIARIPLLFVGKVQLEEMGAIAELAEEGLIRPARFLPPPFAELSALTAWLAYSSFLNRLDLARIESDYASLLA